MDISLSLQPFYIYMPAVITFALVVAFIPFARLFAQAIDLTDKPGGRKHHEDNVPLIGGLVIMPIFMVVGVLSGFDLAEYGALFVALTLILGAGALDDKFQINAWVKFIVQFSAAFLIVLVGDARIYTLGDLLGFGEIGLEFMSIPFSVVAVVLLINAINLMDGLDGLAAGMSAVITAWLMAACIWVGYIEGFAALSILLASICGFLFYNMRSPFRKKASVFLGDAGSMALGLCLAWFSIKLAQEGSHQILQPVSVAWLLALPIMDECGQFVRRIREGRHPFDADRGHFHHHFVDSGIPAGRAVVFILLWGSVLCGVGVIGMSLGFAPVVLFISWLLLLAVHVVMSSKPKYLRNFLSQFSRSL